jgi:hypothetical protein
MYKDFHMKKIKAFFKQAARHKKPWRCDEYMKKIIILDRHPINSSKKSEIMQGNLPTE